MLLLLVVVYACMELRGNFPRDSDIREGMKTWHFMLGLSVFVLVFLRAAVHLLQTVPLIDPAPSRWHELAAKAIHLGLYAFMIDMPLLGLLLPSAEGKPIPFFGLELPALIGEDQGFTEQIKEIHETVGTIGYFLIGLHALAALYLHYAMRYNTLRRMLPW